MGSLKTPHLVRCSCCCMTMMLDHRYTEGDPSRTQITPLSCSTRIPSENPKWWNSQSSTVQSSISTSSISKPILPIQISSGDSDCSPTSVWWNWNCTSLLDGIPRYKPGSRVDMELSRWRHCSKLSLCIYVLRYLCKCYSTHVLMTTYYGNIPTPLLWSDFVGWFFKHKFYQILTFQRRAVRIAKLQGSESFRPAFISLELLALPCFHIWRRLSLQSLSGRGIHP